MPAPRPGSAAHRWVVRVLLALAPIWLVGILDRGLWTPDEPRQRPVALLAHAPGNIGLARLVRCPQPSIEDADQPDWRQRQ